MGKKIIITGITGLIGSRLASCLVGDGYEVTGFTRGGKKNKDFAGKGVGIFSWGEGNGQSWREEINGSYAIVNLAGENIGTGRWNGEKRRRILDSRIGSIEKLNRAIRDIGYKPEILIQASATGYYGTETGMMTDESAPSGNGFLASVCRQVEEEALLTEIPKVICIRTGIVLARHGGALSRIVSPMKTGIAGYPGNGHQRVSWIHIDDVVFGIKHLLETDAIRTVYNFTAPETASMKQLVKHAASLKRAFITFGLPPFIMKAVFGSMMVNETLLANQDISSEALRESGYRFRYPDLKGALNDLLA